MADSRIVLRACDLSRAYGDDDLRVVACDRVDLDLAAGEVLVIRGRSGAGKSTLLNLLGALDQPDSGSVLLGDLDLTHASEEQLVRARRDDLTFIFQDFGLIPVLSAAENVELPLRLQRTPATEREARVAELLAQVGLFGHAEQRPPELSGGQQQRVGIARALASRPRVILADEPTAQLDSASTAVIVDLLLDRAHADGVAVLMTSHDPLVAERADRVLELHDGRLRS